MEHLHLSTLCFLVPLFIITALMLFVRKKPISENRLSPTLPSPSQLPVIGSFHHLLGGGPPHHRLRDLARRHGPLMRLRLFGTDFLIVSSRDAAEDVLRAHDLSFASRPTVAGSEFANVVFSPYGDYWRQVRRVSTTELFTAQRVRSFATIREELVSNLVEEISTVATSSGSSTPVNVSLMVRLASTALVFTVVMGRECRYQEEFIEKIEEVVKMGDGKSVEDLFSLRKLFGNLRMKSKAERLHAESDAMLDRILRELEEEKKFENPENIIEVLLRLKNTGELSCPITSNNIKAEFAGLFGAGTETSTATVEWAMSELIRKPKIMEKVQKEVRHAMRGKTKLEESDVEGLTYLKLVVKETLRLHPSIPLVPRECRERCRIQGHNVPIGQRVLVNLWALGRDPEYWENAECFEPERFDRSRLEFTGKDFNYIPFGAGRRICPGTTFGVVFVELVLANLLFHFDWELPFGTNAGDLDMTESLWTACSRKSGLYLVPKTQPIDNNPIMDNHGSGSVS